MSTYKLILHPWSAGEPHWEITNEHPSDKFAIQYALKVLENSQAAAAIGKHALLFNVTTDTHLASFKIEKSQTTVEQVK